MRRFRSMHLFLYAISTDGGRGGGAVPGVGSGRRGGWVSGEVGLTERDGCLGLIGGLMGGNILEVVVHHRKTPWPG